MRLIWSFLVVVFRRSPNCCAVIVPVRKVGRAFRRDGEPVSQEVPPLSDCAIKGDVLVSGRDPGSGRDDPDSPDNDGIRIWARPSQSTWASWFPVHGPRRAQGAQPGAWASGLGPDLRPAAARGTRCRRSSRFVLAREPRRGCGHLQAEGRRCAALPTTFLPPLPDARSVRGREIILTAVIQQDCSDGAALAAFPRSRELAPPCRVARPCSSWASTGDTSSVEGALICYRLTQ